MDSHEQRTNSRKVVVGKQAGARLVAAEEAEATAEEATEVEATAVVGTAAEAEADQEVDGVAATD